MHAAHQCVTQLTPFFDAVLANDWDKVNLLQKEISNLENKADELKRELRMQLPNSLLMPVSRRDLLEVLTMQDKIANKAKDIAGLITGRQMHFPGSIADTLKLFIQRSIEGETDRIQIQIRAEIYQLEKELPPVDVIFMYKIIDWIGELADRAQRVGSRLELMLAR